MSNGLNCNIVGNGWANGEDDHFVAQAQYDFTGEKEDELSFRRGQRINVAPKGISWNFADIDV